MYAIPLYLEETVDVRYNLNKILDSDNKVIEFFAIFSFPI